MSASEGSDDHRSLDAVAASTAAGSNDRIARPGGRDQGRVSWWRGWASGSDSYETTGGGPVLGPGGQTIRPHDGGRARVGVRGGGDVEVGRRIVDNLAYAV